MKKLQVGMMMMTRNGKTRVSPVGASSASEGSQFVVHSRKLFMDKESQALTQMLSLPSASLCSLYPSEHFHMHPALGPVSPGAAATRL